MNFIELFFVVSLALATGAGFIFLWHKWSMTRSPLALVLAILVTVLVAVTIAFSLATIVLYLVSL